MKRYNVLWIDDEHEKLSSFIIDAELCGIDITAYSTSKAGIEAFEENIQYWDSIILDAKCWSESYDEVASTDGMYRSLEKITELKHKRLIPVFIYTGQPDLYSDEQFSKSLRGRRFYKKGSQTEKEQLFSDIKLEADKSVETQIRHKYADLFSWIPLSKELLKILMYIENDSIYDVACFNEVRKMLEWVRNLCIERGMLPDSIKELNKFSQFLCNDKLKSYVPLYVQRSLHSCIVVSQEGSHLLTIDKAMKNGEAPYLLRSTVFELLNILYWCKSFPEDKESVESMRNKIAAIAISIQDEVRIGVIEGVVEQDTKGNYFCMEYLLQHGKMKKEFVGKKIRIEKSVDNTEPTKDTYPFFVVKFEILE